MDKVPGKNGRTDPAPPQTERGRSSPGGKGLWIARIAVAAIFAAAIILPLTGTGHSSPSVRAFTAAHRELETGRTVSMGLVSARRFMSNYFQGVNQ